MKRAEHKTAKTSQLRSTARWQRKQVTALCSGRCCLVASCDARQAVRWHFDEQHAEQNNVEQLLLSLTQQSQNAGVAPPRPRTHLGLVDSWIGRPSYQSTLGLAQLGVQVALLQRATVIRQAGTGSTVPHCAGFFAVAIPVLPAQKPQAP